MKASIQKTNAQNVCVYWYTHKQQADNTVDSVFGAAAHYPAFSPR